MLQYYGINSKLQRIFHSELKWQSYLWVQYICDQLIALAESLAKLCSRCYILSVHYFCLDGRKTMEAKFLLDAFVLMWWVLSLFLAIYYLIKGKIARIWVLKNANMALCGMKSIKLTEEIVKMLRVHISYQKKIQEL